MIIVNQEGTEFVNFDNIVSIGITDCDEDGFGLFATSLVGIDDIYKELGYYKTEKRAKEVLQEIIKTYCKYAKLEEGKEHYITQVFVLPEAFKMPKE